MFTSTGDIVEQWKGHFKELFDVVDMPSIQEAVPGISGVLKSLSVAKANMVVIITFNKAAGEVEICNEMLKALDNLRVVWFTCLFNVASKSVPLIW